MAREVSGLLMAAFLEPGGPTPGTTAAVQCYVIMNVRSTTSWQIMIITC